MAPGTMSDRIRHLLSWLRVKDSASTLLSHVSEIGFPIQKRVEFGRLGELDLEYPTGALGFLIDELGLAFQCLVYPEDFAAYGRIEVACGLNGFDDTDHAALLHFLADVREINKGHVAELFLSVVSYSNGSETVLDSDVYVILAVSNLHGRCWTVGIRSEERRVGKECRYRWSAYH